MLITLLVAAWGGRYAMDDNHPEWTWRTLETASARVHYPTARDGTTTAVWTASRVAEVVDPIWSDLCSALEVRCEDRLDIVVLEDTDDLEGFTLPSSDWVVFSGHPGNELARMRGRADWVPDLLAHELAHVAMDRRTRWLPKNLAGLGLDVGGVVETEFVQLGGLLTLTDGQPYWFSEGSAEFWSEQIGVNRWTSARDRLLSTTALEGRLLDPDRWTSGALLDDWRDGERAYQQGYAFLRWLAERHGVSVVRELCARSRRPRKVWEHVFDDVFGESLETLRTAFETDVLHDAQRRRARVEAAGRVEGVELALWSLDWTASDLRTQDRWTLRSARERLERRERTGRLLLHAAWSPDGRWFARQRSGWLEVREVDPSMFTVFAGRPVDRGRTREQRSRYWRHSAWFPSAYASRFAFVPGRDALVMVDRVGADAWVERSRREWNQLYWVDLQPDGPEHATSLGAGEVERRRRRRPLPGTERGFDPAVSPNGDRIAFVRYADGGTNLCVLDVPSGVVEQWTHLAGVWLEAPSWSPDGSALVVARQAGTEQDLYVYTGVGEGAPLFSTPWEEVDPTWAADGSIWFAADVEGVHDVYRWDPSSIVHRMTRVVSGAQSPKLTPDGHLVYAHFTSFGWKTMGLRASEWAWEDASAAFRSVAVEPAANVVVQQGRRYRAFRAMLPVALSPRFRLDRTIDGRWQPRVGAFLRLRDAVENHTVLADGWVGADRGVEGRYTWHGLWPDLFVNAGVVRTRLPEEARPRTLSGFGVGARLPLRGDVEVGVRVQQLQVQGSVAHRTTRWVGELELGDDSFIGHAQRTGGTVSVHPTLGFSGGDLFVRVEVDATTTVDAPIGADSGHRLLGRLQGGWTDRDVASEDDLWIGGDHPDALRPGRVESSAALVGYAPYSVRTGQFVVAGGAWRLPLARRLGQRSGAATVDDVQLDVGGDLGLTPEVVLADAYTRLRIGGVWSGRRTAVAFTVAYGLPIDGGPGGWRGVAALGSGL